MIVLLFEDDGCEGLAPVASTRPAFELRTGALNLRERVGMLAPEADLRAGVRPSLRALLHDTLGDLCAPWPVKAPVILLNARLAVSFEALSKLLARETPGALRSDDGVLLAAWLAPGAASTPEAAAKAAELQPSELPPDGVSAFTYPWQVVHANRASLLDDATALRRYGSPARRLYGVTFHTGSARPGVLAPHTFDDASQAILYPGVHLLSPDAILLGPGARILPGAVLDAESGPIVLGAGCRVGANASLEGPLYLGPGTSVNPGAKLREGTSAGAFCKLGGEIEDSIVMDLSNKQHEGFLGHALLGSWVNLGADTNGSDLKNNYGQVRVDLGDGPIETGETFVGPTFGDHAKTGINTMLSTGAVIGVAANVFGADFPPKFVPAFTWGGQKPWVEYALDRALATATAVMARRDVSFTAAHAELLSYVFAQTQRQRH